MKKWISIVALCFVSSLNAANWPVLRSYEGENLRRIKLPLGGIGTGTVSLSGRGSLLDWETRGRPGKGLVPRHWMWAPHFAIRTETVRGERLARVLEGPLFKDEYENCDHGCDVPNHGLPRFDKAVFKVAYPLAQIEFEDKTLPVKVRLEAFNPLVKGDADSSGIPAILFRWFVKNPTADKVSVSLAATQVQEFGEFFFPEGFGTLTRATKVSEPGWNIALDRYWRHFLATGEVRDTSPAEKKSLPVVQQALKFDLAAGETRAVEVYLAWRNDDRWAWNHYDSTNAAHRVGNYYCTKYPTASAAVEDFRSRLDYLEGATVSFVRSVVNAPAPLCVREAALFNVSTLRTETCFRTRDGHFFGWEGCYDQKGSCPGSCTHVWGYEHCLVDIWPELAKDMTYTTFTYAMDAETGAIVNRIALPLGGPRVDETNGGGGTVAAADGQMQCIIKACENWKKTGDNAWLKGLWPRIRKAMSFAWVEGGWDGDVDGVMEGCQHNTMDIEYYGPNPQMEFLYLAALEASAEMATACEDTAFAEKCRALKAKGSEWTENNLFNGSYYEHRIVPPKGPIAEGLRDPDMGARDLSDPDFQLGSGCLIDQLLGDYAARAAGLGSVVDGEHAKKTLDSVLKLCRMVPGQKRHNFMRSFVLEGERSLRMAWYDEKRLPRSPFPYSTETMTGFEYTVAALLAWNGEYAKAEEVVRDIRDRYDGAKRNPFDEIECGHHYARALAAWSVLKAFESRMIVCEGAYGGHLQGVATDGEFLYWSFTVEVVKTDLKGHVLATTGAVPSHHGDLCVKDGRVYVAVNLGTFNYEDRGDSHIYAYDAATLKKVGEWSLPECVHGAGGMTHDGKNFFVIGGLPATHESNYVYEYDSNFAFVRRHELATGFTLMGIQTADYRDGCFLFGIYGCGGNPTGLLVASADFKTVERRLGLGCVGLVRLADGSWSGMTWTGSVCGRLGKRGALVPTFGQPESQPLYVPEATGRGEIRLYLDEQPGWRDSGYELDACGYHSLAANTSSFCRVSDVWKFEKAPAVGLGRGFRSSIPDVVRGVRRAAQGDEVLSFHYSAGEAAELRPYLTAIENEAARLGMSVRRPSDARTVVIDGEPGYNCWPMIERVGTRMSCVYTIGREHNPAEKGRYLVARHSDDGGRTWSARQTLFSDARCGTSSIGKGHDSSGAALFWVRRLGIEPRMALYRTRDGEAFDLISTPRLSPNAMQVTDVFKTPEGLMCLWFSDDYTSTRDNKSWGTLTSIDNGTNWVQRVIEENLAYGEWPTEPSVVALGDGRLLGIARSEGGTGSQFQLTSTDWGRSWTKRRTNIRDVLESTPTLTYDAKTGIVSNYYYHRGAGLLKCRRAAAEAVFAAPGEWPESEVLAQGARERPFDSGNANATSTARGDVVIYYTGDPTNCSVVATFPLSQD